MYLGSGWLFPGAGCARRRSARAGEAHARRPHRREARHCGKQIRYISGATLKCWPETSSVFRICGVLVFKNITLIRKFRYFRDLPYFHIHRNNHVKVTSQRSENTSQEESYSHIKEINAPASIKENADVAHPPWVSCPPSAGFGLRKRFRLYRRKTSYDYCASSRARDEIKGVRAFQIMKSEH